MHQLGGFQYMAALDINMGYYNIRLSPCSRVMTTIGTEFGTFKYKRLPMVMCALVDTFQAKVDKLIIDIEGVKTYIDDILVLIKEIFSNHKEQLKIIFSRLCATDLKVNYLQCSFGLK